MTDNSEADVWKSSSLSAKYLEGVRAAIPLAGEQIDILVRVIAARGDDVGTFLDLGCGSGILGAAILRRWPGARGVFLDFSEAMLQAAREELSRYGDQLTFTDADYGKSGWVDSLAAHLPFDAVVSGFSIHHQTDDRKKALYEEIYDTLAPGGIFLNLEHVSSPTRWIEAIFDDYFVDSLHAMHQRQESGKSREEVADQYYRRPDKKANILAPLEAQCDWLRTIGFEDVDCYFKAFELALFGGRRPQQ